MPRPKVPHPGVFTGRSASCSQAHPKCSCHGPGPFPDSSALVSEATSREDGAFIVRSPVGQAGVEGAGPSAARDRTPARDEAPRGPGHGEARNPVRVPGLVEKA
jgi:hypothetical protein